MAKTYDELIAEIETFESGVKNRATKLRNILTYIAETATTLNPNFWRNTAGTTTNYTTTIIIGQEELTSLPIFLIIFPHATNAGASTIKIDSNSPVALKRLDGTTLQAGDLIYNRPFLILKDNIGEYRLVRESTDMIFPSTETTSVDTTDYIPIQQSGVSTKATKETLFTYPAINKGLQVYDNVGNGVYIEDNGGTGVYIESKATGGGINIRCFNSNGISISSDGDISFECNSKSTLTLGAELKVFDFAGTKKGLQESSDYPLSGKGNRSYLTKAQIKEFVKILQAFIYSTKTSNVGTTETDLHSYTSNLETDGDVLRVAYNLYFNSAAGIIKIYLGSSELFNSGTLNWPGCSPKIEVSIARRGSENCLFIINITNGYAGASISNTVEIPSGFDMMVPNILKLSAIGAASDEISLMLAQGEYAYI